MSALRRRILGILGGGGWRKGLLLGGLVLVGVFLLAHPILADAKTNPTGSALADLIGNFLSGLISMLGSLLLLLVDVLLIPIAGYNNFVTATVVIKGWVVVRDLTNLFFVLMMLVISIGTILGIEELSYRKLLPRLLIMAVLINFSKVIVGLFIDFSQVIMLTFVNGFAAAAGGNMIRLLQIGEALSASPNVPPGTATGLWDLVGGQFLAVTMILIGIIIVAIFCMMLAFRIVMLWILTILSPLVFFLSAVQKGKALQAYSRWWDTLSEYLISGPLLAFFLWLAFTVTAQGGLGQEVVQGGADLSELSGSPQYFLTEAGGTQAMTGFIVGVALLLAGMYVTAETGAAGSGMLRSVADWGKRTTQQALKATALAPFRYGGRKAVEAGQAAERAWFARTGIMLPGTKRKKEYQTALEKQRDTAATRQGLLVRRERTLAGLRARQGEAANWRERAERREAQQRVLIQPAAQARLTARQLRDQRQRMMANDTFVMDDARRNVLQQASANLQGRQQNAQAQGNQLLAANLGTQIAQLATMIEQANGVQVDWNANAARQQARQSANDGFVQEFQAANQAADQQQQVIQAGANYQALEQDRQAWLRRAAGSEREASEERRQLAGRPDDQWLSAALAEEISAEKKRLSPDMSREDRFEELRNALQSRNQFKAQVLLGEIADKEELRDLFQSDVFGQRLSTDATGFAQAADRLGQQLGIDEQSAFAMLNAAARTAAGKGDNGMRGIFVQAAGGAFRIAAPTAVAESQARRLDSPVELLRKRAGFQAIFTVNAQGQNDLSDAGLAAIIAYQRQFQHDLQEGKIYHGIISALQRPENFQRLEQAAQHNQISQQFLAALQQARPTEVLTAHQAAQDMQAFI